MGSSHICFAYGHSILYRTLNHLIHFLILPKTFQCGLWRTTDFFMKQKMPGSGIPLKDKFKNSRYFPIFHEIGIIQNKNRLLRPIFDFLFFQKLYSDICLIYYIGLPFGELFRRRSQIIALAAAGTRNYFVLFYFVKPKKYFVPTFLLSALHFA